MSKNKSFIKNILTTTSMVALTLGAVSNAHAAAIRNVDGANPAQAVDLNGGVGMYVDVADGLKITTGPVTLTIANGQNVAGGIDTGNIAGSSIIVNTNNATIGSISDVAGLGAMPALSKTMAVQVDQATLTLSGTGGILGGPNPNAYDGLGAVTATDNANSIITVNTGGATTFTNTFNGGGNNAIFNASSAGNIFEGDVTNFGEINVIEDDTFKAANVSATKIKIDNGKTMTVDSTNNNVTITGAIDSAANHDVGTLALHGNKNITITGDVGGTKRLLEVTFDVGMNDNTKTVTFTGPVTIQNAIDASAAAAKLIFNDAVTSNNGGIKTSQGLTTFGNDVTVAAGNAVTLEGNAVFTGGTINAGNGVAINGHTMIAGNEVIDASLTTTGNGANGGTFEIDGGDVTLNGSAGVLGNTLTAVSFVSDDTLTVQSIAAAVDIYAPVKNNVAAGANKGTLKTGGTEAVTFLDTVGVGGNGALKAIDTSATDKAGVGVVFTNVVAAQTITTGNNTKVQFNNDVTSNAIVTGTSDVAFHGTTTATTSITLGGAVNFQNNVTTANLRLNGKTATFNTNDATIIGNVTTNNAANSIIAIDGINLTLRGSAGAAGVDNVLNQISLVTDNTFTADSTVSDINIYAPIVNNKGAVNKGTLNVAGGNNITFQSTVGVGGDGALKVIDLTGVADATKAITFANVTKAARITTGAASVVFGDTVTTTDVANGITTGAGMVSFANTVTGLVKLGDNASIINFNGAGINQGAAVIKTANADNGQVWISENTEFNNGTAIGVDAMNALAAVQFRGDKTLTLDGADIFAPVTTKTTNEGTVIIQNNNTTITGDMGGNNALLKLIKIADGHDLTVNGDIWATALEFSDDDAQLLLGGAATQIHAPLTVGADENGILAIDGNNVTAFSTIGIANNMRVGSIEIDSANSLIANANIYSKAIELNNAGAILNLNNAAITDVYGTINGGNPVEGIIEVNNAHADGVTFHDIIGGNNAPKALKIADGKKAILGANATFDNNAGVAGQGGILLGNNSVLNVDTHVLTFNNGAAIDGIADNNGTIIFNNQATPVAIGATHPLQTVRFDRWIGGPHNVGQVVKAGTLDLTNRSVVMLDDDAAQNVQNITSSAGGGIAVLDANNRNLDSFSGTNASTLTARIAQANSLTAAAADYVAVDFTADGTFKTESAGHIAEITTNAPGVGTFNADLSAGGGAKALAFTEAVGGNPNNLKDLTIKGNGANTTVTFANDIYAQTTTFEDLKLDSSARALVINAPTNFGLKNSTVEAGERTITVNGAAATLEGNIVINATFRADGVALDLSDVTALADNGITALTYNINQVAAPAANAKITMIKGLKKDIVPTINIIGAGQANLWTIRDKMDPGVLTYNFTVPVPAQPVVPNANTQETTAAEQTIISAIGHSIIVTNKDNEYAGAVVGQSVLDIVPANFTGDFSTKEGLDSLLKSLKIRNAEGVNNFVNIVVDNINKKEDVFIPQDTTAVFAALANTQGLIPEKLAGAMVDHETSGITQETAQEVVKVFAAGGAGKVEELVTRTETAVANAANLTLSAISSRANSFAPAVFASAPIPAITANVSDLYAVGEGISAGSSMYDRFGMWGVVNAGSATQKQRKGNAGFKNTSQGFTLGVDTMVNDTATVGIAVSNSYNHVKYKDTLRGSKTDTSSWVGSVYAMHQLADEWFVRGTALFNRTNINSKELRVVAGGYGQAKAKYHVTSYGGEAVVGKAHTFTNGLMVTPTVGLRVIHSNKLSYSESGNTNQNLSNVKQDAQNNYSAIGGVSFAKTVFAYGITLTPEAHANFQYGINTKSPKGSFVSPLTPNQNTSFVGTKPAKFNSSYGVSLTGSNDRIECGISGDVNIASKYVGYEGSLKLKVKF